MWVEIYLFIRLNRIGSLFPFIYLVRAQCTHISLMIYDLLRCETMCGNKIEIFILFCRSGKKADETQNEQRIKRKEKKKKTKKEKISFEI